MAQVSRYARGKRNAGKEAAESQPVDALRVPWTNPLKGDEKKVAMGQVSVKRAGLHVGFRVKF